MTNYGVILKPSLDELYHHGIKGQKWGVRNGPPYPLNSGKKKEIIDRFPGFKNDPYSEEYTDSWTKLDKLVRKKSGDWYNQKGVSKKFKEYVEKNQKLSRKYENDKNKDSLNSNYRKERQKLQDKLIDTVLDDLGYEHNKKNKEIIGSVLFWG